MEVPRHITIIMDGNGRWAKKQGKMRLFGHNAGTESVRACCEYAVEHGIRYLSLFAFSEENWDRPQDEVQGLMELMLKSVLGERETFRKNNIRFRVIGDRSRIPAEVDKRLTETEEHTAANSAMTMIVALSYSSKLELVRATQRIAQEVKDGQMSVDDIDEKTIDSHLWTSFMPDPDLLIRTGGELRISNYLLWQIAYSELYFCDTYWPDFDEAALHQAIASYQQRQRRFGKTEAQVESERPTPSPSL